jgi:hypothetical protein
MSGKLLGLAVEPLKLFESLGISHAARRGSAKALSGRRRAWASNVTGMVAITTFQIQSPRRSTSPFCPVVTELRSEQASGLTVTRTLFEQFREAFDQERAALALRRRGKTAISPASSW